MKKAIAMMVLVLGCSSRNNTIDEADIENEIEMEREYGSSDDEPIVHTIQINWRQWKCCIDICGGRTNSVQSVSKEVKKTDYIVCECKDKRRFHLKRILGPRGPAGKGYRGERIN